MPWARLDSGAMKHEKMLIAERMAERSRKQPGRGDAVPAMWVRALCFANENRTNGFIPDHAIDSLSRDPKPLEIAGFLVACSLMPGKEGLWTRVEGGYQIHGYLEFNDSAEDIEARREAARVRMKSKRGSPNVRANIPRTHGEQHENESGTTNEQSANSEGTSEKFSRGQARTCAPASRLGSARVDPPNPPGGQGSAPSVSRDPDEIPEGCVDVVYIRAVRRAGAEPDVSQRERGQMAARWAEAQAEGVSWVRFCAWLDSWAFDWVSSTISAGKAEFNPGWPWKKFTNFVLAEEAKANGAVPNGESRIRPPTPAQVAARIAVSRGVAVPS